MNLVNSMIKKRQAVVFKKNKLFFIDQRVLPFQKKLFTASNYKQAIQAIDEMVIRGAPSIGLAAAYGFALGVNSLNEKNFVKKISLIEKDFISSRPTAHDLFNSVKRIKRVSVKAFNEKGLNGARESAVIEAKKINSESSKASDLIGLHGSKLIKKNLTVMTHCNAGWLAFPEKGSATAPIYTARKKGIKFDVLVSETRPRNQGSRLTAFEMSQAKIPFKIIVDSASAFLMQRKEVDLVITGADRIALNGDAANKIGTLSKALAAKEYGIPFYIAAPLSTFDFSIATGKQIPIEERNSEEVTSIKSIQNNKVKLFPTSPRNSKAINYAFDITPAKFIKRIITEKGIIRASKGSIKKLMKFVD